MIRLLLVDDLVIFRQGLAALISLEPDIEIIDISSLRPAKSQRI